MEFNSNLEKFVQCGKTISTMGILVETQLEMTKNPFKRFMIKRSYNKFIKSTIKEWGVE